MVEPVTLTLAAIAAAVGVVVTGGVLIARNWEQIKEFFIRAIKEYVDDLNKAWDEWDNKEENLPYVVVFLGEKIVNGMVKFTTQIYNKNKEEKYNVRTTEVEVEENEVPQDILDKLIRHKGQKTDITEDMEKELPLLTLS